MERKPKNKGLLWAVLAGIGALALGKKTTTAPKVVRTGTATLTDSTGGGGSVYSPPVVGFLITGVGQTVTGLNSPQTVVAPARVINIMATPAGTYSGTATLKTANGTVLHTEPITNLNISSSGAGAYPAIYFNPTNTVWNIPGAGTYQMQIALSIQGTTYTRSVDIVVTNDDLGIVSGGTGVSVVDYSIANGNQVVLSLTGGTVGQNVTIQLKQGQTVTGTLTAPYAATMTVQTNAYGYLDVVVGGVDLGGVYVPYQIAGNWTVERAKSENDGIMTLEVNKVGGAYILTDTASNGGWANVEYWHNTTFLGAAIPNSYAIEANVIHHITKKVWQNGGAWISYDGDPNPKQKRQQTLKIVSI